jgi:hypothetical protein
MTLWQVTKSGLPFRRPCWRRNGSGDYSWVIPNPYGKNFIFRPSSIIWSPNVADITANDYITESQLPSTKQVFQWRYRERTSKYSTFFGHWKLSPNLMTAAEAAERSRVSGMIEYELHAGPFEVTE